MRLQILDSRFEIAERVGNQVVRRTSHQIKNLHSAISNLQSMYRNG